MSLSGLHIQGVSKTFSGTAVLKAVALESAHGEFVSLLGPSGCGKTTLLRIVAGFERPDAGQVTLNGADITEVPAERRNMGMVFQAYSLFPNLSVAQNIRFGLRLRRAPKARREALVMELLDMMGLSAYRDRYPHQLSGGQQQRVALARALAIRPALLLLDEPLSALDAQVRVQLREEIRRIQRETQVTTLLVTHDQEEALSIADRVAVMHEGRVVQFDTPATIYHRPADAFVATFIGASTRLEGQVANPHDGIVTILGVSMPATHAKGFAARTPVMIFIRPEAVRLNAADEPGLGLAGDVVEHTFFGATTRLLIVLREAVTLMADIQSTLAEGFPVGSRVRAMWPADAPQVLRS